MNFVSRDNAILITTPSVVSGPTRRPPVTFLISLNDSSFRVSTQHHRDVTCKAVIIPPNTWRILDSRECRILSLNIEPGHPAYLPMIRLLGGASIMPLASDCHAPLLKTIAEIRESDLHGIDSDLLVEKIIYLAAPALRMNRRLDERMSFLLDHLNTAVLTCDKVSLTELSSIVDLSKDRLSHLFAESIGLSMRSYVKWRRYCYAMSLLDQSTSLSDLALSSGYADASHMTREFVSYLGFPPSFLRKSGFSYYSENKII